ncbi:hypothetical protein FRC11_002667, partial [Ceratobasidium sp. 423]
DPVRRTTYNQGRSTVNIQVATQVVTHTDHEIEDQEAHELEERDHKQRPLDDSDMENSGRLRTISLVPEDDQESTRTADTSNKRGDWGTTQAQGWRDESSVGEPDRRVVTFSPPPEGRTRTGEDGVDHNG